MVWICLIFYQLSGGFLSKSYRLPSIYGSIPRPSRDHYGRLRHVSFLSFSLSSSPLVPDLIRLSLLDSSADCQSAFSLSACQPRPSIFRLAFISSMSRSLTTHPRIPAFPTLLLWKPAYWSTMPKRLIHVCVRGAAVCDILIKTCFGAIRSY